MTDHPAWSGPENLTARPWLPMEPIRTGFGGVVYWRSRDRVGGHHQWRITPGVPTTSSKEQQR